MSRVRRVAGVSLLVILFLSVTAHSTVITNIQGTLKPTEWYYGDGDYFQTNYSNGGMDDAVVNILGFTVEGESVSTYYIYPSDGTFAMEPSDLLSDGTSGNGEIALGFFDSGATLTINGNLYRDFGDYGLAASGDLIIGEIIGEWQLEEQTGQVQPNTVAGRAIFAITGGVLSDSLLNTDGLVMGNFYVDFTFENCSPTVTDFTTLLGDDIYTCNAPKIQMGVVPEPSTVALLGLGALALFRRKKR